MHWSVLAQPVDSANALMISSYEVGVVVSKDRMRKEYVVCFSKVNATGCLLDGEEEYSDMRVVSKDIEPVVNL